MQDGARYSSSVKGDSWHILISSILLGPTYKYRVASWTMQFINRAIKHVSFLRGKPGHVSLPISALSIPQRELVDEELVSTYNPRNYYPAKPGEILANSYQLLVKIGWGAASTVWLAQDVTRHALFLLSVTICIANSGPSTIDFNGRRSD